MGAVVAFAALWQLSGFNAVDPSSPSLSLASVGPVSLHALEISPKTGRDAASIPTLYLLHDSDQSEFEQQLSVLLGSSFVRAGTVNVIKPMTSSSLMDNLSGSYQLILSELEVQGQSRVETQVVNMDTGEVLMASTMTLDKLEDKLSATELESIESMASSISSVVGPVYRDYCQRYANSEAADCLSG
jgi:hypothetical protein